MSGGGDSGDPQLAPPLRWQDLLGDDALRRLVRLAAPRPEDTVVWLGVGGARALPLLHELGDCSVEQREGLGEVEPRSLALLIAPQLAGAEGLEGALRRAREVLATDGVLAVIARTYLGSALPAELAAYWASRQVGPILSVKGSLARIAALGYEPLTAELLAASSPGEDAQRLPPAAAGESDDRTSAEPAVVSRPGTVLGLLVGRRVEPDSPPRWPRRGAAE